MFKHTNSGLRNLNILEQNFKSRSSVDDPLRQIVTERAMSRQDMQSIVSGESNPMRGFSSVEQVMEQHRGNAFNIISNHTSRQSR